MSEEARPHDTGFTQSGSKLLHPFGRASASNRAAPGRVIGKVGIDITRVQGRCPLLQQRLEAETPDSGAHDGGEQEQAEQRTVAGEDHKQLSETRKAEENQVGPRNFFGGALVVGEAVGEAAELEEDPVGLGLLVTRPPLHAHVEVGVDVLHQPQHGGDKVKRHCGAEDLGASPESAHSLRVVGNEDLEHRHVESSQQVERHQRGDGEVEGPGNLHTLGCGVEIEDEDAIAAEGPVENEHQREGGAL
ncbi:hypothetical protein BOVATA_017440 [Babesia ovata]|uniref:Uncharacterized protein n=1 Tax=Babesia ovata TaxID=189622 RepID=A0A2H6KB81_9APIC|nr:uncharacterized protein BOVATA_017440 [Babesia ovata]GBE60251.1 hypothetical protein BOVATA_017440 [Babesia ovata]